MTEEPKASSTPKIIPKIKSRRPIGGNSSNALTQSPIHGEQYENELLNSDSEETDDISSEQQLSNTEWCTCLSPIFFVFAAVIVGLFGALYYSAEEVTITNTSLKDLIEKFPSQNEDFWLSVKLNVEEILKSNQPKTFLFLYDKESQKTTDDIVYNIAKYATCTLTNCSSVAVTFQGNELNTQEMLNDYGNIIASVKNKLEASGVMIVKNLEDVSGTSAQAFHSLCDELNPLVKKALFIFTIKVEFDKNDVNLVEKHLRNHWRDIKDDLFYPLFTRISYNIIPITTEHQTDL